MVPHRDGPAAAADGLELVEGELLIRFSLLRLLEELRRLRFCYPPVQPGERSFRTAAEAPLFVNHA